MAMLNRLKEEIKSYKSSPLGKTEMYTLGASKVRNLHNPSFHRSRAEEPEVVYGVALLEEHA